MLKKLLVVKSLRVKLKNSDRLNSFALIIKRYLKHLANRF